ncbi:MAG: hypothetical protein F6K54_00720 [Okeania sp. SIO3B5]|nr:hypothetical protein [Okeania sp. SIO3B5]NEO51739.1 hypothetical protein [Okeania sp. SIO3B5]
MRKFWSSDRLFNSGLTSIIIVDGLLDTDFTDCLAVNTQDVEKKGKI